MKVNAFALAILVASANAGSYAKKQRKDRAAAANAKNTKKEQDVKLRGQKGDEHEKQHRELHPHHTPGPCDDGCTNPCQYPGQYFPHCSSDPTKYLQCGAGNKCVYGQCMHGNVWDPTVGQVGTCVSPHAPTHPTHPTHPPVDGPCDDGCDNPCQYPGQYFPHCSSDPTKYLQCGAGNKCVYGQCMHGNVWDPTVGPVGTCVAPPGGHPPHPPHTTDPPQPPACVECQDLCYDLPYYKDTMPCKDSSDNIVFDKYVVCSHGHHHHHNWGHRYCAHEIECSGAAEFYKECFNPFTGLNNVGCATGDNCPGMDNRRVTKTPLP